MLLGVPSVSPEAPAVLSSPSGEQDDETWLESLQRDVKLVEPPGAAWDLSKTDIRRNARNPTYKPRPVSVDVWYGLSTTTTSTRMTMIFVMIKGPEQGERK